MENENRTIYLMLGYLCVANEAEASLERKVEILDRFDLKDDEISKICNRSVQSIRNARSKIKKSKYDKKN